MRHGRAKAARKTLQFYRLNGTSVRPPYRVLLDGTFLVASVRQKVPLQERCARLLQNEAFAFHVTRSTLDELLALHDATKSKSRRVGRGNAGDDDDDVFARARQFGLDECEIIERKDVPGRSDDDANQGAGGGKDAVRDGEDNRSDNDDESQRGFPEAKGKRTRKELSGIKPEAAPSDASEDMRRLATDGGINRRGYMVATQDESLSDALRDLPYVPLLRLSRAVLLLESPSAASRRHATREERGKLVSGGGAMTREERELVQLAKDRERESRKEKEEERRKRLVGGESRCGNPASFGGGEYTRRKLHKAKGPNPLSCKKRKVDMQHGSKGAESGASKKRSRRKKAKSED